MKANDIQKRCSDLALRVVKMTDFLPEKYSATVMGHQIIRSATSVSANYRAACRSKSRKDFVNKMKVVEEELDETLHWLEFIGTMGFFPAQRLQPLMKECDELLAIMVKSLITAKRNAQVKRQLPPP